MFYRMIPIRLRKPLLALAAAVSIVALSFSMALAHAVVIRSDPADGAVISHAPAEVRLWFSEAISPRLTQALVLNAAGAAIPDTSVSTDAGDATSMTISLPDLPDGLYNVVYSTLSADDGHATRGHLVFKIAPAAIGANLVGARRRLSARAIPPSRHGRRSSRGLNFTALAGLAGAIAVVLLLLRSPGGNGETATEVEQALARGRSRVWGWAMACAVAGLAIGVATSGNAGRDPHLARGGAGGRNRPHGRTRRARFVFRTPTGLFWIARQIALLAIIALLWPARGAHGRQSPGNLKRVRRGAAVLALVVLGVQALSGHTAADQSANGVIDCCRHAASRRG